MNSNNMPVLDLSGTPYERGYQHGQALKTLIAANLDSWRADLGHFDQNSNTAKAVDASAYLHAFITETAYADTIERYTPTLLDEVKGLADGAEQPFEQLLAFQLMDEEWAFGLRYGLDKPTSKCTAFAVPASPQGDTSAGQNMDIGSWADGRQTLLRIRPTTQDAPEALVFSIAGALGVNGLNSHGVGITCNTLNQWDYNPEGLPVFFILRTVLEKSSIDEAEAFLRSIPHASGQNYILSSANAVRCFECGGSGVVAYEPAQWQGKIFHTNHPLVPRPGADTLPATPAPKPNSVARLDSISHRLGQTDTAIALPTIKAALAAHDDPENPVSRDVDNEGSSIGFTIGSSIYEFTPVPRLHQAAGPPCKTDYLIFNFNH